MHTARQPPQSKLECWAEIELKKDTAKHAHFELNKTH